MSVLILPPRETPALWSQTPRQRKCTACQTHWVRKAGYTYTNWPSRRKESKRQVLSVNHVLHHPVRKYRAPLGFGVNIRTRSIFTNRAVYFYERMRISLYTATKTRGPFRATVAEAGFYDRGCMTADRHIYTHDFHIPQNSQRIIHKLTAVTNTLLREFLTATPYLNHTQAPFLGRTSRRTPPAGRRGFQT